MCAVNDLVNRRLMPRGYTSLARQLGEATARNVDVEGIALQDHLDYIVPGRPETCIRSVLVIGDFGGC